MDGKRTVTPSVLSHIIPRELRWFILAGYKDIRSLDFGTSEGNTLSSDAIWDMGLPYQTSIIVRISPSVSNKMRPKQIEQL